MKTEALPIAKATPIVNKMMVNTVGVRPMWKVFGPVTVCTVKSVCG